MALIQRIKRVIKASKLTEEELAKQAAVVEAAGATQGDGKAEWLGEGSTDEFLDQQREDKGMRGWYDKFKVKAGL